MTNQSVVVAVQGQVTAGSSAGISILQMEEEACYGLDPVGSWIWRHLQVPRKVEELHALVVEEFEVDPERCRQDLQELLGALAAAGLIEIREAGL